MNETLWDSQRQTMTDALEETARSLRAYGGDYDHWAIAYSGGKDSSCAVTVIAHLLSIGQIPKPKSLRVIYADTRMELTPLSFAAMGVMERLKEMGIETEIVLPTLDDRFFVYMFGRGVPPPSNTFRWCTSQIKIEPMLAALKRIKADRPGKFLMITGVRIGESAQRDARIAVSCSKDGAECGQGWFQVATPEAVADTLAPILHWRVCLVWKWLRDYAPDWQRFPTQAIAEAYGGDEAEEINARTGCVGCNLASRDTALESILKNPHWQYLSPLLRLRPLYAELKKPHNRLRKDGTETKKDGSLVANPMRLGPLTMKARLWGHGEVTKIQDEVNWKAVQQDRPTICLINREEHERIFELISSNTWPNGWAGTEVHGDVILNEVMKDGSVQHDFFAEVP
jgi:DNA sulfur modification protein DndC